MSETKYFVLSQVEHWDYQNTDVILQTPRQIMNNKTPFNRFDN